MRSRNDTLPPVNDLLECGINPTTALKMLSPYLPGYPIDTVDDKETI
jgi:hypothetical protein